ncbi:hypothetical protein NHX12_017014 [Muraenolepis orangiensis]|uniref:Uncharacterized protein n=1 Tax=Muraenolepis orangiensis TaxID=630683 RepID=A0A9Q0D3J1_9TELE|nr:hypothetical protein NHX12_017014 [Muraenolepis orangiensis]
MTAKTCVGIGDNARSNTEERGGGEEREGEERGRKIERGGGEEREGKERGRRRERGGGEERMGGKERGGGEGEEKRERGRRRERGGGEGEENRERGRRGGGEEREWEEKREWGGKREGEREVGPYPGIRTPSCLIMERDVRGGQWRGTCLSSPLEWTSGLVGPSNEDAVGRPPGPGPISQSEGSFWPSLLNTLVLWFLCSGSNHILLALVGRPEWSYRKLL